MIRKSSLFRSHLIQGRRFERMVDYPVKIIDIDLRNPIETVEVSNKYKSLRVLIRLHGTPLGYVCVPLQNGRCPAEILAKEITGEHSQAIARHFLSDSLATTGINQPAFSDLLNATHTDFRGTLPLVTVAVCSRDRTDDLAKCLDSLSRLDYPALDLLVVDNAPSSPATERLVHEQYPQIRYTCEIRPGLDWARNRAIAEARGEIIAFTDDDVIVDAGWVKALAVVFIENPEVMAMTGLVVPYELETEAQVLFESYGGFGRGFKRRWYRSERAVEQYAGAGQFGTGANMAYRRKLFEQIGGFDPALDVGTPANGGGDLEMFFRVLQEGHTLVYEPSAIVYHRHRRDYAQLRTQITNNGIGFYSYLTRSAFFYSDERMTIIRFGLWWLWWWNIRRLLNSFLRSEELPRDLILAEMRGSLAGFWRYQKARRVAARLAYQIAPAGR